MGEASERAAREYPEEVRVVEVDGREFVLVGTAHVSRESADLVRRVIAEERPDRVCIELDQQRFEALTQKTRWESLDVKQLIRTRQLTTLLLNLVLASYQKRLGHELGVMPGTELLAAAEAAGELGVPVSLCDRNVRVTILRAWRSMSLWKKNTLLAALLQGMFSGERLSEADLRELRRRDVLSEMIGELARELPVLKRVLIDERDAYLAQKIRDAAGSRIVAVVGAGHLEGLERTLGEPGRRDLTELETIPAVFPIAKIVGWLVPLSILAGLGALAWFKGPAVAGENVRFWVLITGIPCAIGAALGAAHPATIIAGFFAAPITTLSPVLGAGHVTALVQAWVLPPRVRDFQNVSEELGRLGAWWRNRLLRVFLAFVLPTIGAMIGVYLGGARILRELM